MSRLLTTEMWKRLTAVSIFAIFPVHVYEVLMMQRIFPYSSTNAVWGDRDVEFGPSADYRCHPGFGRLKKKEILMTINACQARTSYVK